MDRYEEPNENLKKSRTNKNQELYTDVYLNNAFININEISEVVNDNSIPKEKNIHIKNDYQEYSYEEKNYDIKEIIAEAINNNTDNLKRSLEQTTEIESIIKSINESQLQMKENNNLLEDLLPDNDTTTVVEPLSGIINTSEFNTRDIQKDQMSNDLVNELSENKIDKFDEQIVDESLKDETKINKKPIFIILGIIFFIAILLFILIKLKIIKWF